MVPIRHRGSRSSWRKPKKPTRVELHEPPDVGPPHLEETVEAPLSPESTPVLQLDPLRIMGQMLWFNSYDSALALEWQFLEQAGLIDAAQELQHAAGNLHSTYKKRKLSSKEKAAIDNEMRLRDMATAVLRQGNQKQHSFSICARSIARFVRRVSEKDWAEAVKKREYVLQPAPLATLEPSAHDSLLAITSPDEL